MMALEADYVQSNLIFSKETNLVAKNLSFDSKADWSKLVLLKGFLIEDFLEESAKVGELANKQISLSVKKIKIERKCDPGCVKCF